VRLAVLALVAMAMVSGTASAGSTYFFCSMMGEQRAEPCCRKSPAPTSQIDAADCGCCSRITLGKLPDAFVAKPPAIVQAPRVAAFPVLLCSTPGPSEGVQRTWISPARAGPRLPLIRTKLMVYLV
jgi:hypothetical protein